MSQSRKNLYSILFLLWISHFFVDFMIGVWPIYKTMFHLDLAKAGLISALSAFIGEGMQVVFGLLSDRGYRTTLILSGVLAAAANCFLAYTENYILIFFLFLTVCIGSGAFHPSAVALAGDLIHHRRGLLITLFATGGSLGFACSQTIYTTAYQALEGQTVWLLLPYIFLGTVFVFYGFSRLPRPNLGSAPAHMNLKRYLELFLHAPLRNLYISQVASQAVIWGFIFLLPDVLVSRQYDTWVAFGGAHFFFIMGSVCWMIPGGHLADQYSPRKVMLSGLGIGSLLLYTFLLNPVMPVPLLLGLLFLMGASLGMLNPIFVAYGMRFKPDSPGVVSAFLLGLAWCISEGLGQAGGGFLTKLFEDDAPAKALLILGSLTVVSAFALLRVPSHATAHQVAS